MSDPACRTFRELLGVYVVGAIEPSERGLLEAHLAQCQDCRDELAGLAVLPALMHRIPVAEAEELAAADHVGQEEDPAPQVLTGLLAEVSGRRRARRRRTALAVAAAIIVAVGGGAAVTSALGQPSRPVAASAVDLTSAHRGDLSVSVRYDESRWGTAMWVRVRGVPEWTQCKFWVTTADGRSHLAGGWLVGPGAGNLWYPVHANVKAADVTGFVLASAAGKVLLRIPA
jgi:anti-sigma factor RsiW